MGKRKKRLSTAELVERMHMFNHHDAAERLEWLQQEVDRLTEDAVQSKTELHSAQHEHDGMNISQAGTDANRGRVPSLINNMTPTQVMEQIALIEEENPKEVADESTE